MASKQTERIRTMTRADRLTRNLNAIERRPVSNGEWLRRPAVTDATPEAYVRLEVEAEQIDRRRRGMVERDTHTGPDRLRYQVDGRRLADLRTRSGALLDAMVAEWGLNRTLSRIAEQRRELDAEYGRSG